MDENSTQDDARAIATLLPKLVRRLFAADRDLASELPLAQLRVCGILMDGPLPMSALGRELRVSLSAMTQIADRLERAELVQRLATGTDRRVRCLQLTPRGETMMRERQEGRVLRVATALDQLGSRTRREVRSSLELLLAACENGSPPDNGAHTNRSTANNPILEDTNIENTVIDDPRIERARVEDTDAADPVPPLISTSNSRLSP